MKFLIANVTNFKNSFQKDFEILMKDQTEIVKDNLRQIHEEWKY